MTKGELNRIKLKQLIDEKGLSMRGLSLKAGMSESYIKDLVSGKTNNPTVEKIVGISDALGCAPNDLIPLEWQKSITHEINIDALKEAIQEVLESKEPPRESAKPEQKYELIAMLYEIIIRRKNKTKGNVEVIHDNKLTI